MPRTTASMVPLSSGPCPAPPAARRILEEFKGEAQHSVGTLSSCWPRGKRACECPYLRRRERRTTRAKGGERAIFRRGNPSCQAAEGGGPCAKGARAAPRRLRWVQLQ